MYLFCILLVKQSKIKKYFILICIGNTKLPFVIQIPNKLVVLENTSFFENIKSINLNIQNAIYVGKIKKICYY